MRFLVADDHELVRKGLMAALHELEQEADITDVKDAGQTLDAVRNGGSFDLILLDLFMPGADGFELLREICNTQPDTPTVVLSASEEPLHMRKALDLGAAGYIPKSAGMEVMLSALRLVLAGGIYVPPDLLRKPTAGEENTSVAEAAAELSPDGLTSRQQEVLRLLGEGKSNKEIARVLDLSENTVKIHVAAVLKALGVNNRTKAAVVARELGMAAQN